MAGDAEAVRARIEAELLRVIATAMKLEAADIRPHQPLRDLGLDSLMALELSLEIESVFGVKLPTMAVAGGPPPRELADRVARQLAPAADEPDRRSARPAARLDATMGAP